VLPLALLLLGSTGAVPIFKQLAISHAMIIGVFAAVLVCRFSPQKASLDFFKGFGEGFAQIFGIIVCALAFVSGANALGLVNALIKAMIDNPSIAKISATFGPLLLGVISGSGEAASIAFNNAVTVNAEQLGLNPLNLGSLAAIAGAFGRTMSPISGVAIVCAGFAGVSPLEIAKRSAPGMLLATVALMIILIF
jgi:DcuC family C4-dicarboxylate transporter